MEPSAYERHEIDRLRFGIEGRLSAGERGIVRLFRHAPPLAEIYRISVARGERQWTMQLEDAAGRVGELVLYLPQAWTVFRTDPGDGRIVREGEPLLYKELRLEGAVDAQGMFKPDITARSRYRLLLQGRGNACFSGADFTSWILQLEGPDPARPASHVVYYSIYGRLDPVED